MVFKIDLRFMRFRWFYLAQMLQVAHHEDEASGFVGRKLIEGVAHQEEAAYASAPF
jgi:hypothetical protein